jgi:uncharacterized protein YndB with AHSA1/START domain
MDKFVTNEIEISAPASRVWEALVKPELTKLYMFGCETVSDWKVGSDLLWRGSYEGKEMVFVKGKIVSIEPGRHLAYTTFDPNNKEMKDTPENYTTVTYDLLEVNNSTVLKVRQGDFSKIANGEERFKEVSNNGEGWDPILQQIKRLVEVGEDAIH